jgi:hypothetical protein
MRTVEQEMEGSFVLVPAEWTVGKARQLLAQSGARFVVVRRPGESQDRFYVFVRSIIAGRLSMLPADRVILAALDLGASTAAPALALDADPAAVTQLSVALDQDGTLRGVVLPASASRSLPPIEKDLDFAAYPALSAPAQVPPQQPFALSVGFAETADPSLARGGHQIVFLQIQPADICTVLLHGDGVTLDRYELSLPLSMQASQTVTATPTQAQGCATIRADYYFRGVQVGQAERIVGIGAPAATQGGAATAPPPLQSPDLAAAVDLTVTVRRTSDGRLVWTALGSAADLAPVTNCYSADAFSVDDARRFTADLMAEAERSNATTASVIESLGAEIAALVPQAIWDLQAALAGRRAAPLLVLLKTDEPFIPWELALLPAPLAADRPPFWAAQTCFGRWIDSSRAAQMPPLTQEITRLTAVASRYGDIESNLSALPHAVEERDLLVSRWHALSLLAKRKDLEVVLVGARSPGHMLHIAAHGESIPTANEQHLILADGDRLSPRELAPRAIPGQPPLFSLVFLNACQVAAAGTSLGQTAGFPGIILNSGTSGFLAPLWKVNDDEALRFASHFYEQTLQQGEQVGAVLYAYRGTYQPQETTTRLAYVWYGHPALRLSFHPVASPGGTV